MKIVITESQLKTIVNEMKPLDNKEKKERLIKSLELAKKYPNPRQFAVKHKNLWSFLRGNDLVDVVFPNRKKYNNDYTPETATKLARRYVTVSDFESAHPSAYQFLMRKKLLSSIFPEKEETSNIMSRYVASLGKDESPYNNPDVQNYLDHISNRAGAYDDMKDLKKKNPTLYKHLSDLGHEWTPSEEDYEPDNLGGNNEIYHRTYKS